MININSFLKKNKLQSKVKLQEKTTYSTYPKVKKKRKGKRKIHCGI